jgi:hypothetical protein
LQLGAKICCLYVDGDRRPDHSSAIPVFSFGILHPAAEAAPLGMPRNNPPFLSTSSFRAALCTAECLHPDRAFF